MHTPAADRRTTSPLAALARSEAFPGMLLIAATAIAIAAANGPWSAAWNHLWHQELTLRLGDQQLAKSVSHWINDGLMVLFFFFVGLELKHEVLDGHLQSVRQAALPLAAAIGGMAVPAALYALTTMASVEPGISRGFGIPMATDIAFALGVLALLGRRVPTGLKVFLATLAIADDLGAVIVIAAFYTDEIAWQWLVSGVAILGMSYAANRAGVRKTWPYAVMGVAIWLNFLQSGVHATIAGVALALTVPARRALDEREFSRRGRQLLDEFDRTADPTPRTNAAQLVVVHELHAHCEAVQAPLQRMTHGLHPFIAHAIVPLFALANAGVDLRQGLDTALAHPAAHGVFVGLLLGKPLGVLAASVLAVKLFGCRLPHGVGWRHLHGAAWLAGIGFTMALFIDSLAFAGQPAAFDASKLAILAASLAAGTVGFLLLRAARPSSDAAPLASGPPHP